MYWANRSGKKVVISALFPYYETLFEKAKFLASAAIYKVKLMREMARLADHVIVVNDVQAEVCQRYFSVPPSRISIAPNVVKNEFFAASGKTDRPNQFTARYNVADFILTTGNVCQRKNQLNLAKACIETGTPLVIIGKVLDGETKYSQQLEQLIEKSSNVKWIRGLEPGSDELIDAYRACSAFALPSFEEQQPISLLEAAAMQKPLLIADRAYAYQKYYANALKVDPGSVTSLKAGLQELKAQRESYIPPFEVVQDCLEVNVGNAYKTVYEQLM
ncbi:glycosyltransferase [Pontibacter ramchanderi]|uniref:glycosyltransferase n=1 Tax=Pontibacter ramchanderi TaxID=1179743 RepID=UPI001FE4F8B5|nr:glycosyltransferase [Pontibacter ramchanderi]